MSFPIPTFGETIKIFHILGVTIGAGGAFLTDVLFMHTLQTKTFEKTHIQILALVSKMVWTGVLIAVASGFLLFSQNTSYYLGNPQFFAKMTIVTIILVNGTIFHFFHLPILKKLSGKPLSAITNYPKRREMLLVSGAFSSTSWVAAIVLGSTLTRSWDYLPIMIIYLLVIGGAISTSLFLRDKIIPTKN